MITKKYRIKKSCISVVMIAILQCGPLLTLTSYASEPELVTEAGPVIRNDTKEPLENYFLETLTESLTQEVLVEGVVQESTTTEEITHATTTPPILEIPQVQSTGTSTEATTTLFSNASSSSDSSFEISTTTEDTQEDVYASSTFVLPTASSTELIEDFLPNENDRGLPSGTTTISTGASVALANILNITNTNLVNSTGSIILENVFNNHNGDLDTRFTTGATSAPCTLLSCNSIDTITANITSESTVNTTVSLIASSGSNEIHTADVAVIDTGDVYAGLNLVNIANTTLIDSHYLLLSLNSFGNFNGDIIFPSLSTFFSSPNSSSSVLDFGNVTTQTSATITNNLNIGASSGENEVSSSTGFIQTGSTDSSLNLYNNTNSTLLGGSSLLLLLKVTGTWLGNLVGIKTPANFIEEGSTRVLHFEENLHKGTNPNGTLVSSSTALLTNNVEVLADSGKNITTDTDTSNITTGDAYASANVINIANTHIIGRNWILAIITIFGNFTGNIAFGRPDLWIGEQVSATSFIENDTELLYRITVTNKGDSDSSNVIVTSSYDTHHLDITSSSIPYSEELNGNLIFAIGNMAPKESKEITFYAKVKESTPGTAITNTVVVQGDEKDNNKQDNTDTTTITTMAKSTASSGGYHYLLPEVTILAISPKVTALLQQKQETGTFNSIIVSRVSSSTIVTIEGTLVEQTIIIKNPSQTDIPSVTFNDFLIDSNGKKIKQETWDIGTLLAGEEVTLTYFLSFEPQVSEGMYTLSSEVIGTHSKSIFFGNNGTLTYLPKKKKALNIVKPAVEITSFAIPSVKINTQPKKTTLEVLIKSIFIETVYAENEATEGQTGPSKTTSSPFQYVLLFVAFSTLRFFQKQPRLRTLK